ncbi:MAG: hypothetical protein SFV52_13400 [Saprospiraceae bacterium]|nr:hypothetical protein [Saprospiraceae bacterium]
MVGFIIARDAEKAALSLPRTYGVDDVTLVFQWKTFDAAEQIVEMDEEDNEVLVTSSASTTNEGQPNGSCPVCNNSLPMPTGVDASKIPRADVFDLAGRLMQGGVRTLAGGQSLDVSALPIGVYFLEMRNRDGQILAAQCFVKQ